MLPDVLLLTKLTFAALTILTITGTVRGTLLMGYTSVLGVRMIHARYTLFSGILIKLCSVFLTFI